jgi:predicted dehydrogenase
MTHDVLLVGTRGFGAVHLRNLERLSDRARLIAVADPAGGPAEGFASDVLAFPSLDAALDSGIHPDITVIATPTGTHFPLAMRALEAGSDVYLEKPPVATMDQFSQLLAAQERTGRAVQIGFQSFGSHALEEIAALGAPTSIATWASWTRDAAYWSRSAWAGRRTLDGVPIVDGVVTNPLAHAIATSLRIAGARRREDVQRIDLELYHANDIEADDTSSVRITLHDGRRITAALTLASPEQKTPLIEVRTKSGDVVFAYTEDELTYADGRTERTGRTDLFEELLDHREHGVPLSSPLVETGAFMTVLEAVRTAPSPFAIPASELTVRTDGPSPLTTIDGIDDWIERTARSGALFSELDAPFARAAIAGRRTASVSR